MAMVTLKELYKAKDNATWSKIADYLLYVFLPFIQTSLALAETNNLISMKQAYWAGIAVTFLIVNTKFLTKFTTDAEQK